MARPGDELVGPNYERIVFRKTAAETNGELLEVDAFYKPGADGPPDHYHPHQEERFQVISGEILARVDGAERRYKAGEAFVLHIGSRHTMRNGGSEEAHVIWQTRPALNTEAFFETMLGLARDGKTSRKGVPNLLQAAILMREYQNEFRLARPPFPTQKVAFSLLAPIGTLFGYRGRYSRYSGPT